MAVFRKPSDVVAYGSSAASRRQQKSRRFRISFPVSSERTWAFDIKPYVPLSDCVPDALEGYTKKTKEHILSVHIPEEKALLLPKNKLAALKEILQLDPRPGYDDSPEKLYGLSFAGYNIKFSVKNDVLCVSDIEKIKR